MSGVPTFGYLVEVPRRSAITCSAGRLSATTEDCTREAGTRLVVHRRLEAVSLGDELLGLPHLMFPVRSRTFQVFHMTVRDGPRIVRYNLVVVVHVLRVDGQLGSRP